MLTCNYCNKEIKNLRADFCEFCGNNIKSAIVLPGTTLYHERYKIVKPLDSGGMASIYLAEDLNLDNTPCVIKVMLDNFKNPLERNSAIQKFKDEAVILARLRHPGLPVVMNHFIEENRYYLVMDYVSGKSLDNILYEVLNDDCLLAEELIIDWGIQICDILHYLHTNDPVIVHRDIKPENIIERLNEKIMLLDFGVARIFSKADNDSLVGTMGYAAPEQYKGEAYPESDIFALGASLHRLLTGYDPAGDDENAKETLFTYPSVKDFRDDCSSEIQTIISKATALEVKDRYPSALELKKELLKLIDKAPEKEASKKFSKIIAKPLKIPYKGTKPSSSTTSLIKGCFKVKTEIPLEKAADKLSRLVSIDIGSYEIKLLQLEIVDNSCLYPKIITTEKTPEGAVSNGIILDPHKLSKTLKSMIEELGECEFITAVSPYCTCVRTIKLSSAPLEKIPELLSGGLKQLIPLPVEDSRIEYEIISPADTNEKNMKVRVTAILEKAYKNLEETLSLSGIKSCKIYSGAKSIVNLMKLIIEDNAKKQHLAVINMGSEGTSLTLVRDSVLAQTACFMKGGKSFTDVIMKIEQADYNRAEELKRTNCDADMTRSNSKEINLFQILIHHFTEWMNELSKTLNQFGPDYRLNKFDSVIFSGGGLEIKNLHKYINNQLNIKSSKFFIPECKKKTRSDDDKIILNNAPVIMTCMGLIVRSLKEEVQFKKKPKTKIIHKSSSSLDIAEKKASVTIKLPDEKNREIFNLIKKELSLIAGPMAEFAMEEYIKKSGHTSDTFPTAEINNLIKSISGDFSLSQSQISDLIKKVDKNKEEKTVIPDNSEESPPDEDKKTDLSLADKNILDKFKREVLLITGPMAELVWNKSIKKLGYGEDMVPFEGLNKILEEIKTEFNLSEKEVSLLKEKIGKLKSNKERSSDKNTSSSEENTKSPKKGILSFLFGKNK